MDGTGWPRAWMPACCPQVHALPHEHTLQQLLVTLRVAGPVLLHIFVHAVLQCARAILGVHTGHLQHIQLSLTVTACGGSRGGDWGYECPGLHWTMPHHLRFPALELLKAQTVLMRHSMSSICSQPTMTPHPFRWWPPASPLSLPQSYFISGCLPGSKNLMRGLERTKAYSPGWPWTQNFLSEEAGTTGMPAC